MLPRFLQPIRNIPFPVVIRAMANVQVEAIDTATQEDRVLVEALSEAARRVGPVVRAAPIRRNRPNEVGNDIEPFVIRALSDIGLAAERPRSAEGRGKQVGYPDILVRDDSGRATYVECKVFGEASAMTTMRSFYLSPSKAFKVCCDARHVLMAFAVQREPIEGSRDSSYRPTAFKLVDLHGLKCDVKYEFNSDNVRLYHPDLVLAQGAI